VKPQEVSRLVICVTVWLRIHVCVWLYRYKPA